MATSRRASSTRVQRDSGRRPVFTKLVVAAIDFGTTYSGYAYSFYSDHKKDPLKIIFHPWSSDDFSTEKTPTCVLFDKDKRFHSFGYEAESKYAELAEEGTHIGWRFFKQFKMMLILREGRKLKRREKLKDDQGHEMLAIDVFSASIKYLKSELLRHITDAVPNFRTSDVQWVISVPAIWDDSAKQFMREAAYKAGIDDEQLALALEPEGAAIYCKEITVKRVEDNVNSASLKAFAPGSKFLLLDLGGGTVDITVEQVEENGTLSEVHQPTGGPWGGSLVDQAFHEFLINIFGKSAIQNFSENYKSDELYLLRNFESVKRKIDRGSVQPRILRIPASLVTCAKNASVVKRKIEQSPYNGKVELKSTKDKLAVNGGLLEGMFNISSENIVRHVKELFTKKEMQGINTLILVGGFSESALIAKDMRAAFPNKEIIIPQDSSLAVLKGAVLYGHNPQCITSRRMPYTYGISTAVPFDKQIHPEDKKVIYNGAEKCEDIFQVFFEVGQIVTPGETKVVHNFHTSVRSSSVAIVEIYRTRNRHPDFVSDAGCSRVGRVELKLDTFNEGEQSLVEVTFLTGHTELEVQAKHAETNKKIAALFEFLV